MPSNIIFFLIYFFSLDHLDKTNIPNISSVRSIRYGSETRKIYKASSIGDGLEIKYIGIQFENNMRVTSPFTATINDRSSSTLPKEYMKFLI